MRGVRETHKDEVGDVLAREVREPGPPRRGDGELIHQCLAVAEHPVQFRGYGCLPEPLLRVVLRAFVADDGDLHVSGANGLQDSVHLVDTGVFLAGMRGCVRSVEVGGSCGRSLHGACCRVAMQGTPVMTPMIVHGCWRISNIVLFLFL